MIRKIRAGLFTNGQYMLSSSRYASGGWRVFSTNVGYKEHRPSHFKQGPIQTFQYILLYQLYSFVPDADSCKMPVSLNHALAVCCPHSYAPITMKALVYASTRPSMVIFSIRTAGIARQNHRQPLTVVFGLKIIDGQCGWSKNVEPTAEYITWVERFLEA